MSRNEIEENRLELSIWEDNMQENIPAVIAKDMYPYKGEGLSDETKSDKHFIIITEWIHTLEFSTSVKLLVCPYIII